MANGRAGLRILVALTAVAATAIFTGPAWAGACLCVSRNMENDVVEFSCQEMTGSEGGAAGCSTHCSDAGHNGYDWLPDETCNGLYDRIKSQKVKINITDIVIGPVQIGVEDEEKLDANQAMTSTTTGPVAIRPVPVPHPGATYVGSGNIEADYDTFDVPDGLGGGSHTTTTFSGNLDFRLEPDPNDSNRYLVYVTSVSTTTPSMNLGGFATGTLHGSLNPAAPNDGELNLATGEISFLFSQILYPEDFPGVEIHTWSHYYGTCNNCLNGGDVDLEADSFFISPIP